MDGTLKRDIDAMVKDTTSGNIRSIDFHLNSVTSCLTIVLCTMPGHLL
jgi:hypothetical protein